MNKYAALGLMLEAQDGKRVVVVSHNTQAARHAMLDFESLVDDSVDKVRRTNGQERIYCSSGGWIRFLSQRGGLTRYQPDVWFIDWDVEAEDPFLAMQLALSGANVTRA